MTKEEKVLEILAKSSIDFVTGKRLIPNNPSEKCSKLSSSQVSYMIKYAALEIATWKEEQMIQKAVKFLDEHAWEYARDHQEVATDKMIDNFKQAMKGE